METYSQLTSFLVALDITRIVDGRCYSLENPGATIRPSLILFGRGPANRKMFFLDNGVLQDITHIHSGGAWSIRLDAKTGGHSFSVCTSDGAVSSSWDIVIEASPPASQPTVGPVSGGDGFWFKW